MVVRTPSKGELTIYSQFSRVGSSFYSVVRARQYLQHACTGYLAYVVDTLVEGKKSVSNVPTDKEFLDVFP